MRNAAYRLAARADSLKNISPSPILLQLPQVDKRKFAKYK